MKEQCNFPVGCKCNFWTAKPSKGATLGSQTEKEKFIRDCVKEAIDAIPAGQENLIDPALAIEANCEKEWNKNHK